MNTDKIAQAFIHGAFGWVKGPLISIVLVRIVIMLIRNPPGRLR